MLFALTSKWRASSWSLSCSVSLALSRFLIVSSTYSLSSSSLPSSLLPSLPLASSYFTSFTLYLFLSLGRFSPTLSAPFGVFQSEVATICCHPSSISEPLICHGQTCWVEKRHWWNLSHHCPQGCLDVLNCSAWQDEQGAQGILCDFQNIPRLFVYQATQQEFH